MLTYFYKKTADRYIESAAGWFSGKSGQIYRKSANMFKADKKNKKTFKNSAPETAAKKQIEPLGQKELQKIPGAESRQKPKERFENTHGKILQAAAGLFSKKGFKDATTKEIAAEAGITEITLYRHFKSKEDIFFEIVKNMSMISMSSEIFSTIKNYGLKEKLEYIAFNFIKIFKQRSGDFRMLLAETITRPEMSRAFFETVPNRAIEMISGLMQQEICDGTIGRADPKLLARAFLGMFLAYNMMQEILLGKELEAYDENTVVKFFTSIFLNGALKKNAN